MIESCSRSLQLDPKDQAAYSKLHLLVAGPRRVTQQQRERARSILRMYASGSNDVLVAAGEPGAPMAVTGTVHDAAGKPIAGALVHVFQADAQGRYTLERAMNEPHARIFAFLKTSAEGRYEMHTIRPGSYQRAVVLGGVSRYIPQHIHFEVSAAGFAPRRFQLVFDDDPRMDDHWHRWAASNQHPVARVAHGADGFQRCVCDIVLQHANR